MSDSYFSKTYAEARSRFRDAAAGAGAFVRSYAIDADCDDALAIDVASFGAESLPTVVTSSGVHGVEGFFGSAVQCALLERLHQTRVEPDVRHVLIHSVNPFGFSRLRRFNEDNVDLNRNFLADSESYEGTPDGYPSLDGFLNPESPPSRFESFRCKAIWSIWRHGLQTLKQSVAGGQYEYPRGLFFGGHGPCKSTRIIRENCDDWLGRTEKVVHIDLHSGLGAFGAYKLLLTEPAGSVNIPWYTNAFGAGCVEPFESPGGTAYKVSGLFGEWMQKHFASREYRFVTAEFRTYDLVRVVGAIRAENRAHHYGRGSEAVCRAAKAELLECFCPKSQSWRRKVVASGLDIISRGASALHTP